LAFTSIQVSNTSSVWNGNVRDLRVWTRALSASEIAAEYVSGIPVHPAGLLLWAPFDDNLVNDRSGNGHLFAATGTGQLVQAGPLMPRRPSLAHYLR
jgi:hypothetical protein